MLALMESRPALPENSGRVGDFVVKRCRRFGAASVIISTHNSTHSLMCLARLPRTLAVPAVL